jgi:hypothetical protein
LLTLHLIDLVMSNYLAAAGSRLHCVQSSTM